MAKKQKSPEEEKKYVTVQPQKLQLSNSEDNGLLKNNNKPHQS